MRTAVLFLVCLAAVHGGQIAESAASKEWASYQAVYRDPFVVHLRKALDNYARGATEGNEAGTQEPIYKSVREDLARFDRSYYRSKFIVLAIHNGSFGGKIINVVFLDKSDRVFTAWVYRIAESDYELRGFQEKTVSDRYMQNVQESVRATQQKDWPSL